LEVGITSSVSVATSTTWESVRWTVTILGAGTRTRIRWSVRVLWALNRAVRGGRTRRNIRSGSRSGGRTVGRTRSWGRTWVRTRVRSRVRGRIRSWVVRSWNVGYRSGAATRISAGSRSVATVRSISERPIRTVSIVAIRRVTSSISIVRA